MHKQLILFGAPGTGKSYRIQQILSHLSDDQKFRVTVHPEFLYTDFVGQLLPDTSPGSTTNFVFKEGPFTRALMEAYSDSSREIFLILEELSRGNVAAIFGDIFQLLDRDAHFESRYPIRNKNIADKIPTLTSDEVKLPSNFNIICTVNMNDQNVFPMDTAFKRRFDWKYIPIDPVVDGDGIVLQKLNNPKIMVATDSDRNNDIETNWQSFYMALNRFITDKIDGLGKREDKQVGQFFIDYNDQIIKNSYVTDSDSARDAHNKINEMIRNKLLIYLWQDVQGNVNGMSKTRIFDNNINSYDELYKKYGNDKVFSDKFINDFLKPKKNAFPYS